MIKTTGAEFWRFYDDENYWPEGAYHEDTLVKVDGIEVEDYDKSTIQLNSKVEIEGGYVVLDEDNDKTVNFETHFKKWRKGQNTETIMVECPKDKIDAIKAAIKAAGGKTA